MQYGLLHRKDLTVSHISTSEWLARKTLDKMRIGAVVLVSRASDNDPWTRVQ